MAVKSNFAAGDVLTASNVNTYLTNGGLVYITSGALSGATTNFTSCFSSTYDNYRIVVDKAQETASGDMAIRMLVGTTATTAAYYFASNGLDFGGTARNVLGNNTSYAYAGFTTGAGGASIAIGSITMDIYNPNQANRTTATFQGSSNNADNTTIQSGTWRLNDTTAYDGIQFLNTGAGNNGGQVTIYGYRKA